ncbi:MAG: trypsin-like peptidase domain-containing protein [Candidatus Peregrinibacteria bacterium]|nr:trypsin-like peptidase domain-containing protein [Candidatus Peregrinibacteria bacterium]
MQLDNASKKLLSYVLVVGLLSGFVGGMMGRSFVKNSEAQPLKNITEDKKYIEESDYISAIQKVSPAVVSIIESKNLQTYYQQPMMFFQGDPFFNQFFGQQQAPQQQMQQKQGSTKKQKVGGGSGFIVTSDGLVVTNRHVVQDPEADYTVVLSDGREYKAQVLSKDTLNDLAVIKILPKDDSGSAKISSLPVVEFGDSDSLKVGQRVLAIGNALGEYQNTVTAGIISAQGRKITANDGSGSAETLTGLLQTDAAINPGNSGGPLVNMQGQVIGVNVAIAASANNIGFAIPFNDVSPVITSVQKTGKIVRPYAGVRYQMLTEERAKELELTGVTYGALLLGNDETGEFAVIPGGPGDKAGLKKGDVILEIDGKKLDQNYPLQQFIRNKKPGDSINLKVWTSGKTVEKMLVLSEAPDSK